MSASLPRHLLKWLLGLDLSAPVKNLKRDFSNGFLVAEICCHYLPSDFALYSYEKVESAQRKADNWRLLERQFKRLDFPITPQQCADVRGDEMSTAGQFADLRASPTDAGTLEGGDSSASVSGKVEPAAVLEGPRLEFDLQRRPIDWKPYPPSSYLGKEGLDPKRSKYWRLGGLGKDENEDWQAKIQGISLGMENTVLALLQAE
ncbi:hypothetical protein WJX73_001699 [Symbiochloris irregularis]|uniref:CH-like domain-containing protein n=1 Tax=Symbiochloris irregularis TaxID=706552 RepID=A0AAW1PLV4_9CHLO